MSTELAIREDQATAGPHPQNPGEIEKYRNPPNLKQFTEERQVTILQKVTEGRSFTSAAWHAGISPRVLDKWLKHGGEFPERSPMAEFTIEVRRARASYMDQTQDEMLEQGRKKGRWEPFARTLECFDPDTWKRPGDAPQVTVQVGIVDAMAKVRTVAGDGLPTGD